MPTRIRWPEVEVELTDAEVDALRAELDALAGTPKFAQLAPEIRERFQPGVIVDREQLSGPQILTLLRAFDHLRNARQLGHEGHRVRDAMTAAGITYVLDIAGAAAPRNFVSYGGLYEVSDRLVGRARRGVPHRRPARGRGRPRGVCLPALVAG